MTGGRLIAVVGASGVGKDSVIDALVQAVPCLRQVRRVITRPADVGGENHIAVTFDEFTVMREKGDFCIDWHAHGYRYGIPVSVLREVRAGEQCIANFSRGALQAAATLFPVMVVLNITAEPATLAQRLAERGRESAEDIERRLERAASPVPSELDSIDIANDGPLKYTVAASVKVLGLSTIA
ncbi:MAG: phosphonate metabolism protein/1,5-bisphosphokinase (PRPP-forming) PhnN [Granulosicoccus sp.]